MAEQNKQTPAPEAEQKKAAAVQDNTDAWLEQYDVSSDDAADADPANAAAPTTPVTPTPEAPKITHPKALVRRARELGATDEQIASQDVESLAEWVDSGLRQREQDLLRNLSVPTDRSPAKPAAPVTPEPDPYDEFATAAEELGMDPRVSNFIKAQNAKLRQVEEANKAIMAKAQADIINKIDDAFDYMGEGWKHIVGQGTFADISKDKAVFARRRAILNAAGLDENNLPPPRLLAAKLEEAALLLGMSKAEKKAAAAAPAAEAQAPGYGIKPNGFSKEQWDRGALTTPTGTRSDDTEKRGPAAARAHVARFNKERGLPPIYEEIDPEEPED